jgi:hypothetical protein
MTEDNMKSITGTVVKKTSSPGSKSEHEGFYLLSGGKQYLLRKPGRNPFETAADFSAYEGRKVNCVGSTDDYVFFVDQISIS